MIRAVVADSHALHRAGLCRLMARESDIAVVGVAADADSARLRVLAEQPDVAVAGIALLAEGGSEIVRLIHEASPRTAVLVLAASTEEDEIVEAMAAGASGYLAKGAAPSEILRAIRCVHSGETLVVPVGAAGLLAGAPRRRRFERAGAAEGELTPRELDVLRLVVAGADNLEIGRELYLSPNTVKHHLSSIFAKLRVHNRVQAAVEAIRLELVASEAVRPPSASHAGSNPHA